MCKKIFIIIIASAFYSCIPTSNSLSKKQYVRNFDIKFSFNGYSHRLNNEDSIKIRKLNAYNDSLKIDSGYTIIPEDFNSPPDISRKALSEIKTQLKQTNIRENISLQPSRFKIYVDRFGNIENIESIEMHQPQTFDYIKNFLYNQPTKLFTPSIHTIAGYVSSEINMSFILKKSNAKEKTQ